MSMSPSHLLYLHGFRSSPQSANAVRLQAWLHQYRPDVQWWCPQLPASPHAVMTLVNSRLATWPGGRFAVLGSSLGGFYATVIAQAYACPVVLLNPAINPARDLAPHVGEQTSFHDPSDRFFFLESDIAELRSMYPTTVSHVDRYAVVIAKGDEVLDWREMCARYAGCTVRLLEGGDHALSDFDDHMPFILNFLNLLP